MHRDIFERELNEQVMKSFVDVKEKHADLRLASSPTKRRKCSKTKSHHFFFMFLLTFFLPFAQLIAI